MEFKGATFGDFQSFLPLTKAEASDYSYTVESLVKGRSLSLEEGVRLLNSSDPELTSKRLTEFLQSIAIKDSKGAAEYCLANLSESPDVRTGALKACFYSEIDINPVEGMAYAMKIKSENASLVDPFLFTDCTTRFFLKDSRKAGEWLDLSVNSTTGVVHDALQAARSIHIAGGLDFAEARRILSKIQDPQVILQTQPAIDRLEQHSIRSIPTSLQPPAARSKDGEIVAFIIQIPRLQEMSILVGMIIGKMISAPSIKKQSTPCEPPST